MKSIFAPSRQLAARRLKGGGPRIYDARERWLMRALDVSMRLGSTVFGMRPARAEGRSPSQAAEARRILALRLDRIGDLVTTIPALVALSKLAPEAEIELAVGSWNEPIARNLGCLDAVRVVDTPWASWGKGVSYAETLYALSESEPDLAIDFQGDFRVLVMMAMSKAALRAGYADTGGTYLLTHVGAWDETKSWYRQNMDLLAAVYPHAGERLNGAIEPYNYLLERDRESFRERFQEADWMRRPGHLIGIHPSAGRRLKQWEEEKFAALISRLKAKGLNVLLTGTASDRPIVERIQTLAGSGADVWIDGGDILQFSALVEHFDLFVSGDTGPMHIAQAMHTANVALFGPSDPVRYGPEEAVNTRTVVREPLYCSPCNMIRRPPPECARAQTPECMQLITVDAVEKAVMEALGAV